MNTIFLQALMVNYNINKNNYFAYNNISILFNLSLLIPIPLSLKSDRSK